jgi:hypothetical protein
MTRLPLALAEGGALEHLEYNVALNSTDNVSTAACDWSLWHSVCSRIKICLSRAMTMPCLGVSGCKGST